jgi:hypothetical protein
MTPTRPTLSLRDRDALHARFAQGVVARLSEQAEHTPHDITERLRSAREQALDRARQARRVGVAPASAAAAIQRLGGGNSAVMSGPGNGGSPWWFKLVSMVPVVMLFGGLLVIEQQHARRQIDAAAEVDVALLADNLPPAAYSDPGFVEFLKTAQD